jgi:transcriptional regulator with XRE-family HTH domain
MVNTEDFIKRLEYILEYYSLTASIFADTVGVQRSGLSHLMSGRNKPSLDFILKIVEAYPEVDIYWLLNGRGSFPASTSNESHHDAGLGRGPEPEREPKSIPIPVPVPVAQEIKQEENTPVTTEENFKAHGAPEAREVERIVIFYTDGSFRQYSPETKKA